MNALRSAAIENRSSWNTWLRLSYEAGQAWIVVSIVGLFFIFFILYSKKTYWIYKYLYYILCSIGAIIGLNAALIDIITEWLSDIKSGYCKNSWWLNQKFCCWEIQGEGELIILIFISNCLL